MTLQDLANLKARLDKLKRIDVKALAGTDRLGSEFDFQSELPYFRGIIKLVRDLAEADLEMFPPVKLQDLLLTIERVEQQFSRIQQFSVGHHQSNPVQARSQLISEMRAAYDSLFDVAAPFIAYTARNNIDLARFKQESQELLSDIEQKGTAIISETEQVLEKVRSAAQESGVAHHARHFKNEAEQHEKASAKWLTRVVVLAIATAFLAGVNIYLALNATKLGTSQTIQLAVAKVLLFSFFFGAVVWAARVYRSHRHNFVVNQHRQNALTSFETFAKAASDDQTKAAVLIEATRCIFSPQVSGYVEPSSADTASPRIMEVIRDMTGKG